MAGQSILPRSGLCRAKSFAVCWTCWRRVFSVRKKCGALLGQLPSALLDIIVQFVQRRLSLKSKRNEPIDEVRMTYAAGLPEQREHTDVSEAWYRIDLIKKDSPVIGQKEVRSGHTSAI